MGAVSASESLAEARALRLAGRMEDAERLLRGALAAAPDAVECIDELSTLIHPVAALDLYRRYFDRQSGDAYSIGTYPDLAKKVGEVAVTFYRIGRKDLAGPIVDLILVYRRHLADPAILIELGTAARLASDLDRAVEVFDAAETYPALRFEALRSLAFLHQNAGSLVEAERCIVALLPAIPDAVKFGYRYQLVKIYITQKKYEQVLETIAQAETGGLNPEQQAEMLCYRFLCELELGNVPGAVRTARAHGEVKADSYFSSREGGENTELNAKFGDIFADGAVKHVISLGGNCEITAAARARGIKAQSPFDWLISSHDSMIDILAEGGRRVMTSVSIDTIRLLRTAVCNEHGVLYVHEFPRSEEGQPIVTDDLISEAKRKLTHKMDVFEGYCGADEPILFVRKALPLGGWLSDRPLTSDDVNRVVSTIESRFPRAKFHLAFLYNSKASDNFDFSGRLDPRVIVVDEAEGMDVGAVLDYYNLRSGKEVAVRVSRIDHLPGLFAGDSAKGMDPAELLDDMKEPIELGLHNVIIQFLKRWLDIHSEDDPAAHIALYNIALASRQRGDEAAASDALRACLRLAPAFEPARAAL